MKYDTICDICRKEYWLDSFSFVKCAAAANIIQDWEETPFCVAENLMRVEIWLAGRQNRCLECIHGSVFSGKSRSMIGARGGKKRAARQKTKRKAALKDTNSDSVVSDDCTDCDKCFSQSMEYKKAFMRRFAAEVKLLKNTYSFDYVSLNDVFAERIKKACIAFDIILGIFLVGCFINVALAENLKFIPLGICFGLN